MHMPALPPLPTDVMSVILQSPQLSTEDRRLLGGVNREWAAVFRQHIRQRGSLIFDQTTWSNLHAIFQQQMIGSGRWPREDLARMRDQGRILCIDTTAPTLSGSVTDDRDTFYSLPGESPVERTRLRGMSFNHQIITTCAILSLGGGALATLCAMGLAGKGPWHDAPRDPLTFGLVSTSTCLPGSVFFTGLYCRYAARHLPAIAARSGREAVSFVQRQCAHAWHTTGSWLQNLRSARSSPGNTHETAEPAEVPIADRLPPNLADMV